MEVLQGENLCHLCECDHPAQGTVVKSNWKMLEETSNSMIWAVTKRNSKGTTFYMELETYASSK